MIIEDEIVSIENVGEVEVGDISLAKKPHNFLANGILVSNCSGHSLAYSLISYFTSFFKANYPAEFLIANLRHPKSGAKFTESEYMGEFIQEALQMGIKINLPTIEKCYVTATPVDGEVYLGIDMLKGFSEKTSSVIKGCVGCETFEEFVEKATAHKERTAKVKLNGDPTFKTTITKAHILTLVDIGFFGDRDEALTKYVQHYKIKDKDLPAEKSKIRAINDAFGFELYNRCFELWSNLKHKFPRPSDYKVLKIETSKSNKGKFGDYTMAKVDSNTGKLTAFFKGAHNFKKGDFVLIKFKTKDESTINVTDFKVMEVN